MYVNINFVRVGISFIVLISTLFDHFINPEVQEKIDISVENGCNRLFLENLVKKIPRDEKNIIKILFLKMLRNYHEY